MNQERFSFFRLWLDSYQNRWHFGGFFFSTVLCIISVIMFVIGLVNFISFVSLIFLPHIDRFLQVPIAHLDQYSAAESHLWPVTLKLYTKFEKYQLVHHYGLFRR